MFIEKSLKSSEVGIHNVCPCKQLLLKANRKVDRKA